MRLSTWAVLILIRKLRITLKITMKLKELGYIYKLKKFSKNQIAAQKSKKVPPKLKAAMTHFSRREKNGISSFRATLLSSWESVVMRRKSVRENPRSNRMTVRSI